ncbi:MAG: hypothetical protein H9W81_12365 [Enterococcus sp.]|nr:hypothetical protein [Enterococcus sp.]
MTAVELIEDAITRSGLECTVGTNEDGRIRCKVNGVDYTPQVAANLFISGGWDTIWSTTKAKL